MVDEKKEKVDEKPEKIGEEKVEEKPEKVSEEKVEEKPREPTLKEGMDTTLTDKVRENPWVISTLILGVVTLILLIGDFSGGITGGTVGVASPEEVQGKVLEFINSQVDTPVEVVEISLKNGLYEIIILFEGQQVPIYVTPDGENLVQGVTPIDLLLQQAQQQPDLDVQLSEVVDISVDDDAIKGNPGAPVTIIEFSDYECPFCGRHVQDTLSKIMTEYVDTGKVRIVFRDYPLSFHQKAQKAAEAAECAGEQGKYWEMHDILFANQEALEIDDLKGYAAEIGLNTADFDACLDSGIMADEVAKDMADGQAAGVQGTPASFINGKLISGAFPFEEFQKIIEEELAKVA